MKPEIKRGEIYWANLDNRIRTVVIFQNEIYNKYSPISIVIPISSMIENKLPTHVRIGIDAGLKKESIILCERIIGIDRSSLLTKIGEVSLEDIKKIETAIMIALGINFNENIEIRKKQENPESDIEINNQEENMNIKEYEV